MTTLAAIRVIIGEFRNVDIESLQFAFDSLKGFEEASKGCDLKAEMVNATAVCRGGKHSYRPNVDNAFRCPLCQEGIGNLLSGEELDVVEITLQAEEEKECFTYARVGE